LVFYIDFDNDSFAPNGASGVLKGVSAVFFAHIGFDAIQPRQKNARTRKGISPRGMMWP
jgi:L-asparagine transporter-like permease